MKMTGARILLECLKLEGVDTVFGYPGGTVINIYDELFSFKEIRHILPRHEQAGVHAADGFARATGRVGVAIATSGPGATNTVTGIATAYMDSIPVVVITGQVPTALIGNDAFQEVDIVGITRPCTKHNFLVKDVKDIPSIIKKAFYIARTGRPGPVLVDLPKDVQIATAEFHYPDSIELRSYKPTVEGHPKQIEKAVSLMLEAKKPVIYVGGGVISGDAAGELYDFAKKLNMPVTTTLMGLGSFPEDDHQALRLLGMHGTYYANMAVTNCDMLFAVGARFDDRVTGKVATFAPHAKIIHVDVDPTSIRKNVRVDLPIVGEVKKVLSQMLKVLEEQGDKVERFRTGIEPWMAEIEGWKQKHPMTYKQTTSVIKPQYVIQKLRELSEPDAIIATDVGQHQMWTAQFFTFTKARTLLSSGGLGTMGYGLPAAMGAQAAYPDRQVIAICGDGGFQMNMQELATLVQNRLPVKICILNNNFLGMVRQWQELFFDRRYSQTCMELPIDFIKLAEAFGATGLQASKVDEVEGTIKKAFETPGPVIMEFKIAREEKVLPMVPAGASLNEMVLNA
ncbi:biosynthetic-type acetolactate synthase large subunit [Geobacter sulfurreducens]|uniref:Acetolactate synthase n=1 Tax=Geobacter sulfurreducens (strain ATCC 51573 / DSM 12127 / PCA) TaxID=243231 RepID=Q3V8C8_GEOSL|nr:biosynthetic-type acetolactate synthase large subunit [Geobacter sulfurreducens]AAR35287.1 acetolactate synthase, large subunit, biosynthetic type [Geobacter sulfurreducens PCA]QVW33865.1 biosynthetic-type acetolactate synthase large subunit [Geobacter sulfurreducens]UAC02652.1 biosynthetic-type acetolactate synthase large subunit [Geobacter sulfurreducens]UTG91373.1 biosynthetic-type acetolactate synthase large subunit [Geobacter sulfurreducens]HBB70273.1 biosynthetic-type acetolactate syn